LDNHRKQIEEMDRELKLSKSTLTDRVDVTEAMTKEVRREQHIHIKDGVDRLRDENTKRFLDIEMKLKAGAANAARTGPAGGAGAAGKAA